MSKFIFGSSSERDELPAQPDMERLYRRVRNLLRQYSARAMADAALEIIWKRQPATGPDRLRAAPWHTLLLVKWALQDAAVPLDRPGAAPMKFMDMLRQSLWTHAGRFSVGASNVFAMIRSYMGVQMEYQRHRHYSFLRWPALIAERPENSILRRQFREVVGMEPAAFIDLAVALKTALITSPSGIAPTFLEPLRVTHGDAIDVFTRLFVRNLEELRAELTQNGAPLVNKTDLYEFPYFIRYPILHTGGRYVFWDPVVAEKGFERAVHLRMSSLKDEYAREFGRAFEKYVVSLLREAGLSPIGDKEFSLLGGQSKNVEAIVSLGDANLIVEAKMGLFADPMMLKDSPRFLYEKFAPVRKGMRQGFEVSQKLRQDPAAFGELAAAAEDYLVIVTSRDLLVSGGPMVKQLIQPERDLDYFDAAGPLPLKNTFIMDIQGFETFCMAIKERKVDPRELLKAAAQKNEHVGQGSMFFEQWLEKEQRPESTPALIDAAFDAAVARLRAALGPDQEGSPAECGPNTPDGLNQGIAF